MLRNTVVAAAVATLAALAAPAQAQCFGPDNLSGPCWSPRDLLVPQFPAIQLPGLGICWEKCNPTKQECLVVGMTTPVPSACGQYTALVSADTCSGIPALLGDAVLDYTRTWSEATPDGELLQVWRFALKVDMRLTAPAGITLCPVPPCLFTHDTAFFYGYVDYALRCDSTAPIFQHAVVLYHACDDFIHRPGLSDRPGTFHPEASYAIVAPHTSANPFDPTIQMPATGGPLVAEAVRNVGPAGGAFTCIAEERIVAGDKLPLLSGCACPLGFNAFQQTAVRFKGLGACPSPTSAGSSFTSLNFWPKLPWFEMITTSIGCWTTDASYPGKECAYVDEGLFLYEDSCVTAGGNLASFVEVHYGGSTKEGYVVLPVGPIGPTLTQNFTDIASNFSVSLADPVALPILGSVRPTRHLIYVNTP